MFVSEADRLLLCGGFDEIDGIDADRMWILRHLPPSRRLFGLYYLRMGFLVRDFGADFFSAAFRAHTGATCTRFNVRDWVEHLAAVELAVAEAVARKDMGALSRLKLPTEERSSKCPLQKGAHLPKCETS